jgi:Domain of unknown function (DUF5664)
MSCTCNDWKLCMNCWNGKNADEDSLTAGNYSSQGDGVVDAVSPCPVESLRQIHGAEVERYGLTFFDMIKDSPPTDLASYVPEGVKMYEQLKNGTLPERSSVTGSLRYNSGKVQTREIDPQFLLGIGEVLTKSRDKYPAFNWTLPTDFSTPYESLMRHLMSFQSGEELDAESGKHHLLHVATNVMFLYYQSQNHPDRDDRGFKKAKK